LTSIDVLDKIKRKKTQNKKSRTRPAWSIIEPTITTNGDNKSITNYSDDLGDEDLLDFVADLDFERDTQDIELRSMINVLESRIGQLEKEVEKDELVNDRPTSCITTVTSQQKSMFGHSSLNKESEKDNEDIEDEDRDLLRSAKELLSSRYSKYLHTAGRINNNDELDNEEHALQMIYSQRSLAAVLKSLRRSFQTANIVSSEVDKTTRTA